MGLPFFEITECLLVRLAVWYEQIWGIRRFRSGDRLGAFGYRFRFRTDETSVAMVLIDVSKDSKLKYRATYEMHPHDPVCFPRCCEFGVIPIHPHTLPCTQRRSPLIGFDRTRVEKSGFGLVGRNGPSVRPHEEMPNHANFGIVPAGPWRGWGLAISRLIIRACMF
jgi:hypothetical protein